MNALKELLAQKAKAVIGAILAAVVGYAGTALSTGTALTLHGLEVAAVGALTVALGVHRAPNKAVKRKTAKDAGLTALEVLVVVVIILVVLILLGYGVRH